MKAISIGPRYEIHSDSLKAYDALPAKTYTVRFAQMSGFYLEERTDLAVKESLWISYRDPILIAFIVLSQLTFFF